MKKDIYSLSIPDIIKTCRRFLNTYLPFFMDAENGFPIEKNKKKEINTILRESQVYTLCHKSILNYYNREILRNISNSSQVSYDEKEEYAIWLLKHTHLKSHQIANLLLIREDSILELQDAKSDGISPIQAHFITNTELEIYKKFETAYLGIDFLFFETHLNRLLKTENCANTNKLSATLEYIYKHKEIFKSFEQIKLVFSKIQKRKAIEHIRKKLLILASQIQKLRDCDYVKSEDIFIIKEKIKHIETEIHNSPAKQASFYRKLDCLRTKLDELDETYLIKFKTKISRIYDELDFEKLYCETVDKLKKISLKYKEFYEKILTDPLLQNRFNLFVSNYESMQKVIELKQYLLSFLNEKKICNLYHFTNLANLDSILNEGLLSLDECNNRSICVNSNDPLRLDNHFDYICCSISFPNYKLFYKFRSEINADWCVIEIDANVLLQKQIRLSSENAATGRIYDNSIENWEKLWEQSKFRNDINLPLQYPTNPQAEVLIKNKIEKKFIKKIYFNHANVHFSKQKYPEMEFCCSTELFEPRIDYKYWRNNDN